MKRLVLGIFALTSITQAHALSIGAHAGVNIGGASSKTLGVDTTVESKTGIMGGGFVELGIAPMFFIQPELNYVTAHEGLTYLCLPILAKVKFNAGAFSPYIVAGPDIGFKMGTPAGATGVKSTNFAIDFGGGAEFELNKMTALTFDLRYSMGLTNIFDFDESILSYKTKGVQIMVGVAFGM